MTSPGLKPVSFVCCCSDGSTSPDHRPFTQRMYPWEDKGKVDECLHGYKVFWGVYIIQMYLENKVKNTKQQGAESVSEELN